MGADFRIEAARTDEARRDAYQLRYTVLVGDLGYDIAGMTAARGIVEKADAKATILLAYDGKEPVGTVAIDWWGAAEVDPERVQTLNLTPVADAFSKKNVFQVRKAAVLSSHRTTPAFAALIGAVVDELAKYPAPWFVFIDVDPESVSQYERLGFRCHAPHFRYPRGGIGVPMCLVAHDLEHLASIRSRLLPALLEHGQSHVPAAARVFRELTEGPVEAPAGIDTSPLPAHDMVDAQPSLLNMDLFRGIALPDIEAFLEGVPEVDFHVGDQVIDAAARGRDVYLVRTGFLQVVKTSPMGRKTIVTTLGPGDLIGEMSMLLGEGRTADVVALSNGDMLRIQPSRFAGVKGLDSAVLARINLNLAAILARRLRATTNLVA